MNSKGIFENQNNDLNSNNKIPLDNNHVNNKAISSFSTDNRHFLIQIL